MKTTIPNRHVAVITTLAICAALIVSLVSPAHALIGTTKDESFYETYLAASAIPFTDVFAGDWFYNDVKSAYESGIINGKSESEFAPGDNLTYGEAVKLAACMHQKYMTGSVTLQNGNPWYQPYVDYARANYIIDTDFNWEEQATRAGYMEIFGSSLPYHALPAINTVAYGAIPDVPTSHPNAEAIYFLYRAGIVEGVNDWQRHCNPTSNIKRSEVAAILTRMMDSGARKSFTLLLPPVESLTISASLKKGMTGSEFNQAYDIAKSIVSKYAGWSKVERIEAVFTELSKIRHSSGWEYTMSEKHYNNVYGFFVLNRTSCAGDVRAAALCLAILGIPSEHVNENQYGHQWVRVELDGKYVVLDVNAPFIGYEQVPYEYPSLW